MKEKLLSTLLALCMVFALLPTTAEAADIYTINVGETITLETPGSYPYDWKVGNIPAGRWKLDENSVVQPEPSDEYTFFQVTNREVKRYRFTGLQPGTIKITVTYATGGYDMYTGEYETADKSWTIVVQGGAGDAAGGGTGGTAGGGTGGTAGGRTETAQTYTVTFSPNGGTLSGGTTRTTLKDGTLSNLPTPTRDNYTFDGWYTSSTGGTKVTTQTAFTKNTTVFAHWTETTPTYTVTCDPNGGTISGSPIRTTLKDGTLSTLPAPTRDNYTFDGWYTSSTGGTRVTTQTVFTRNTTVYAHWTETVQSYTVTLNPNGGALSGSTARTTGKDGTLSNLPTPIRDKYTFNGWYTASVGGTRVTEQTTFTEDETIYAHWIYGTTPDDSATWSYRDGTLTIQGTGDMADYSFDSQPWYDYNPQIHTVKISNGLTSIGNRAFYECRSLTSVDIPNSVTSIGEEAFAFCKKLESLDIPDSVTNITKFAFSGSGLKSVTIPRSVTTIGQWAFDLCYGLTDVYYGGSESQWKQISIGWGNDLLTGANIHYNNAPSGTSGISGTHVTPAPKAVMLSLQNLTVDGKVIVCEKYNIDGANYFKLRDLAYTLNNTGSQFGVGYDTMTATVTITTGKSYTPNGTELASGADNSGTAQPSRQTILIDGVERSDLTVYNIGGSNFFQLRELGTTLGFEVDYDAASNTAIVRSTQ